MTTKRVKKVRKRRGSRTYGWGLVHRGSGQKGGAGNAGSGKKADGKKPSNWGRLFGRNGFKPKNPHHLLAVNAVDAGIISEFADKWVAKKQAALDGKKYTIDLKSLGYTKLLGSGKVTRVLCITTPSASARAIEKVKAAGGDVIVK